MMLAKTPFDSMPGLEHPFAQLAISILFDGIGMCTYLIPGLGELADIVWAPIQGAFILGMLGTNKLGFSLMAVGIAEEILPFTDFVPSCMIAWVTMYALKYRRR